MPVNYQKEEEMLRLKFKLRTELENLIHADITNEHYLKTYSPLQEKGDRDARREGRRGLK